MATSRVLCHLQSKPCREEESSDAVPAYLLRFEARRSGNDRCLSLDASSIDFIFAGRAVDAAKRPADLTTEATRILKPEGHLIVLTSSAADAYNLRSIQALLPSLRL